ncbi:cytochrome c oxidase subunit 3 [Phenylobacterium sp.]|uniref:cytochrome c oxidase subunit 3 n=1 Tax=Phenylobacterium sp. TaxID=1871053 RepID=UPI002FCC10BB
MAHGDVKHDYHLVNPSPWPLVGSASATVMALGGVTWMKGLFGLPEGTSWLFFAGLAGVLYTMVGWWSDVVKEANAGDHTPVVAIGLRYGMIMFIASEVMFFVAWFWIFFEMALFHEARTLSGIEEVRTAWATWPPAGIETVPAWNLPLVNTLTLLLSGTTVTWAHHALQQGDRRGTQIGLILTILLGVLFTSIQAYEYSHILQHNYFFGAEDQANSGLYGSSFFMATGFHGFHVLIGTIFLTVCLIRLMNGGFSPKQHFGFEAAAWYWHFVDVVWLFLFAFIYVVFGGVGGH